MIAGFDFSGRKKDAEGLVADLKSDLKTSFPDGRSDILQFGTSELETFTHGETTIATVFKGPWFFASNDLELLKSTLDRVEGKVDAKTSLRDNASYQLCLAKLPKDSDAVVFVQPKTIVDTIATMFSAMPNMDASAFDDLRKVQGISASMKLDGGNIRDTIYIYKPGGEARPPLAFNSKAFTSPETVMYFATALGLKTAPSLPNPALDKTGILATLNGLKQSLTQAGLGFDDFKAAFGPELGMVTNGGEQAGSILTLDVRDLAKAQKFIEALAGGWPKQEIDGVQYYGFPWPGLGSVGIRINATLALTDHALMFGRDINSVQKAVQDAKSDSPRIDKSADFEAASSLVGKPTDSFCYIDTRPLFENVYQVAAIPLRLAPLAYPGISDFCDVGKLPSAKSISSHLTPIVLSQSTDENGTLVESVGPVTFTEVAFGLGLGAVAVAETQLQGPQSHIPSFAPPTPGAPAATPPADQPDAAPSQPSQQPPPGTP